MAYSFTVATETSAQEQIWGGVERQNGFDNDKNPKCINGKWYKKHKKQCKSTNSNKGWEGLKDEAST